MFEAEKSSISHVLILIITWIKLLKTWKKWKKDDFPNTLEEKNKQTKNICNNEIKRGGNLYKFLKSKVKE